MVENPRFPHWCRIIRKTTTSPLVDENDFSPLDSDVEADSPLSSDSSDVLGGDSEDENTTSNVSDGASEAAETEEDTDEGSEVTVIYEGECRSYDKKSTSDKGEIITSYRGLALPLIQDDWTERGVVPLAGDEIIVDHGVFKEYGWVLDKNVGTASFAGTHLLWRYGRN